MGESVTLPLRVPGGPGWLGSLPFAFSPKEAPGSQPESSLCSFRILGANTALAREDQTYNNNAVL